MSLQSLIRIIYGLLELSCFGVGDINIIAASSWALRFCFDNDGGDNDRRCSARMYRTTPDKYTLARSKYVKMPPDILLLHVPSWADKKAVEKTRDRADLQRNHPVSFTLRLRVLYIRATERAYSRSWLCSAPISPQR